MPDKKLNTRIYLTGVGGQGTLTATTLLSNIALEEGLEFVSGEIHGMAQRGGVVESTLLLGGWASPKLESGEADLLLGFEPLETFRGLHYLAEGGNVVSSSESIAPVSVSLGTAKAPSLDVIQEAVTKHANKSFFLPIRTIGNEAGALQAGNTALIAVACQLGFLPFGVEALTRTIKKHLSSKVLDANLKAIELGLKTLA